jgi:hypothetical protein
MTVKAGDHVLVASAPEMYRWAQGKVGYVIATCEECWAAGCKAKQDDHTACDEGKLGDPTVRIPWPRPENAGAWDGYKDCGVPHSGLRVISDS